MKYKIIDNFLDQKAFESIQETIIYSPFFPWYLSRGVANSESKDGHYFTHLFYDDPFQNSDYLKVLFPLLEKIDFFAMKRIKGNFYPKTNELMHHEYHTDYNISHNGIIFYLNTNDGKTIFEDGTIIESISNRALFFDPSVGHKSTTCTNDSVGRFNINLNYM